MVFYTLLSYVFAEIVEYRFYFISFITSVYYYEIKSIVFYRNGKFK